MILTCNKAAQKMAADLRLGKDRCIQLIREQSPRWIEWSKTHDIQVQDGKGHKHMRVEAGEHLSEMIKLNWESIMKCQQQISLSLETGGERLKNFTGGLRDLQVTHMQLCEMQKREEEREGTVISRIAVESIINELFPKLQNSLNELANNIKMKLPDNARADFQVAYQSSLPDYAKNLDQAVKKLNEILTQK